MTDKIREYLTNSPIWVPMYPHHKEPKVFYIADPSGSGQVTVEFEGGDWIVSIWSGLGQPEDYAYQYGISEASDIKRVEEFLL